MIYMHLQQVTTLAQSSHFPQSATESSPHRRISEVVASALSNMVQKASSSIRNFFSRTPSQALDPNDPNSYLNPRDKTPKIVSMNLDGQLTKLSISPNFKKDCCERLKDCFSIKGQSVSFLLKGKSEEEAETHLLAHIYSQLPKNLSREEKINLLQNIVKTMTQSSLLKMKGLIAQKLNHDHTLQSCRFPSNAINSVELEISGDQIRVFANCKCVYAEKLSEDGSDWVKLNPLIRAESSISFDFTSSGELSINATTETQTLDDLSAEIKKKSTLEPSMNLNSATIQQFQDPRSTQGPFVKSYYGTTDMDAYRDRLYQDLQNGTESMRTHLTGVISGLETNYQGRFQEVLGTAYYNQFGGPLQGKITFGPLLQNNDLWPTQLEEKPVWKRTVPKDPDAPVILECEARVIIKEVKGAPLPEGQVLIARVTTKYIINHLCQVNETHDYKIESINVTAHKLR